MKSIPFKSYSTIIIVFFFLFSNGCRFSEKNSSKIKTANIIDSKKLNFIKNEVGDSIVYYKNEKFTGIEILKTKKNNVGDNIYLANEYIDGVIINKKIYTRENGKKITLPPSIDEVIKNGIPNQTLDSTGLVYKNDSFAIIKGKINSPLTVILDKYLTGKEVYNLRISAKKTFNIDNLIKGKTYYIIYSNDSNKSILSFIYEPSKTTSFICNFNKKNEALVYKHEKEITLTTNIASGTISQGGSVARSLQNTLGGNALTEILANNIYAWTIDFDRSIYPGDSFIVYYEEKYINDEFIGIGEIFAASFTNRGQIINAFRFQENNKYVDYFDESGKNLRKAFLQSPIAFNYRISSKFGKRKHPISKKWKNHNGTDYAAPTGTPIRATCDGRIEFAGTSKNRPGNGKYVKIKHNDTYTTLYLHMHRYYVKTGDYVKQGDVIGEVGSTGWSTGPHLHYEMWKNGKQVDHYKIKLPDSLPLKEENKKEFENIKSEFLSILNSHKEGLTTINE